LTDAGGILVFRGNPVENYWANR